MGLSSKQVTSSGIDWNQTLLQDQKLELPKPPLLMRKPQQNQQQQIHSSQQHQSSPSPSPSEPLKCPRCDSLNTKFCYYNNYNKSQPRHFCRTCKRHWTKGGTLRNVPVGGGRKNKRPKKSSATATSSTMTIQTSLQGQSSNLPSLPPLSSSPSSASLFQSLLHPTLPSQPSSLIPSSSSHHHQHHQNLMNNCTSSFLTSTLPLISDQTQGFMFPPFSSSSSNPCSGSTSLRSSSVVHNNNNSNNYGQGLKTMEEPTPTVQTQTQTQPWEMASTSVVGNTEMLNYWTWEDLDSLVSTDLNVPWDDSDLKP